jgi:hypothetical protein
MFQLANLRTQQIIKFAAPTNGETTTSDVLDTKGYDEVLLVLTGTTSNNATNNPATLKVQESDTTDATNFGDIAALVGDGASGFTIPASPTATTNDAFAQLHVRTAYRKRYLRCLVSPLTTQTFSLTAIMGRAAQAPTTVALQGAAVVAAG